MTNGDPESPCTSILSESLRGRHGDRGAEALEILRTGPQSTSSAVDLACLPL
ncbi:MAG: hypothetical protein R3E53_12360 [Myxococcota bacterium]